MTLSEHIQKIPQVLLISLGIVIFIGTAWGKEVLEPSLDQQFLAAREAFRTGNIQKLKTLQSYFQGRTQKYVLTPYVEYWELRGRLEQATEAEIQAFLQQYAETLVAEKLRADWVRSLAKKQQWPMFQREYAKLAKPEEDLNCYRWQQEWLAQGPGSEERLTTLWRNGKELSEPCEALLTQWFLGLAKEPAVHNVTPALEKAKSSKNKDKKSKSEPVKSALNPAVWARWVERFRLAAEANANSLTKKLLLFYGANNTTPKETSELLHLWQSAQDKPQQFLTKLAATKLDWTQPVQREILWYAFHRLANVDGATLTEVWKALRHRLPTADQQYGNGWLATYLAKRQQPECLNYFAISGTALQESQKEWWVRAALRQNQWSQVLVAISTMKDVTANQPVWQYWRGRALQAQGEGTAAKAIFTELLNDLGFYGLLAREELSAPLQMKTNAPQLTPELRQFITTDLGVERAVQFLKLGLRQEGLREWDWASRNYSDLQLLAAAELAAEHQWFDLAINTANRTREHYDWSMRFLAPYRDEIHRLAGQSGLEEGLILGLIRQESRFNPTVVSSSGAKGLMQIMPLTGKWIAKRLARPDFRIEHLHEVSVNLEFGVYYLKFWWERLANSATLAAAAYNAGPSRAQAWRANQAMPGEIYTETIPFTETRDYVKKVLTNAVYYEYLLNQHWVPLKTWLGVVPPRG